jgi:hypothetical protein
MKDTRAKDPQEFFALVATDRDTRRLAYYDERVIERMAGVSGRGDDRGRRRRRYGLRRGGRSGSSG